ncbi:hypothetical protein [Desulfovibrio sp. Huiquan2017]|uniref:sulfotransferase family protein n=1 Tax=Desulfovibrio sp. Huiquan2017 TaxID=2816861 RepID=UPI001A927F72|nr:hypothetical protein [Desulfovibrio sp. Huiquan2017]
MTPNATPRVIVTGMHRSGTSVAAKAVMSLGVDFGADLMEKGPDNPKGYFEDMTIVDHNRAILEALTGDSAFGRVGERGLAPEPALEYAARHCGNVVREKFVEQGVAGCKDPRFCLTYPFWENAFRALGPAPRVIASIRNPLEVAESLHTIHQVPIRVGLRLWFAHNLALLCNLSAHGIFLLFFEDTLSDPHGTLDAAGTFLGLAKDAQAEEFADGFLSPGLKHYTHSGDALRAACEDCPEVDGLYRALADFGHAGFIGPEDAATLAQTVDAENHRGKAAFQLGCLPGRAV